MATFLTLPSLSFIRPPLVVTLFFILILGYSVYHARRNPIVRPLLNDGLGWIPLLCAMAISSGTGMVLDEFVNQWRNFGSLAVVISGMFGTCLPFPVTSLAAMKFDVWCNPGLPASIGAVFVSRLSTDLHSASHTHPSSSQQISTMGSEKSFATGIILSIIGVPVLLIYLVFVYSTGWLDLPFTFLIMFIIAFCITVSYLSLFYTSVDTDSLSCV